MKAQERQEVGVVLRALHRGRGASAPPRAGLGAYASAPHLRRLEASAEARARRLWKSAQQIAEPTATTPPFEAAWRSLVTQAGAYLASTADTPLAHKVDARGEEA